MNEFDGYMDTPENIQARDLLRETVKHKFSQRSVFMKEMFENQMTLLDWDLRVLDFRTKSWGLIIDYLPGHILDSFSHKLGIDDEIDMLTIVVPTSNPDVINELVMIAEEWVSKHQ